MKQLFSDSLTKWLTTLLLSIWGVELLLFAADVRLNMWSLLPVLALWTLAEALLDTRFGFWASFALLAAAEILSFALLGGAEVISCIAVLFDGGDTGSVAVVYGVILMGMAAFSAASMYLLQNFWPRVLWCALWIPVWIWAAACEWEIPKGAIAAAGAVVLMTLAQALYRRLKDSEDYEYLRRIVTVLLAAAGLVLFLLPTSPEPYPYPVLNAVADKAQELYDDMVTELLFREEGEGEFTMDFAGYSEKGDMGEGFQPGGGLSGLLAKSFLNTDGSLYLTGNTWDTFDGREWQSTLAGDQDDLLDWNLDAAERIYALWRYQETGNAASTTAYMRATSVYFQYEGLSTRTLFTAPGTVYISTDEERFPWDGQAGRVLFDYLQTRDTYYRVYYLEQNDARLEELALASEGYGYDSESDLTWLPVFGDYRAEFGLTQAVFKTSDRIEPVLARRQERIYDGYLQIPENISPEVRALAEEITLGCDSNYEKLFAIADYLRSNYSYTTEPAPVPEGKEFLDYVLFEAEEGYCTWYATAATILARCAGVPARYAQGYCVSLEAGVLTALDEEGSHAWCEGYIPGFGWITVEATPGFHTAGDGWEAFPDRETEPEEIPEEETPPVDAEEPVQKTSVDSRILLFVVLVLLAAAGAAFLPKRLRLWRRYRAASWSGKIQMDLERFLASNVRRDMKRRREETLRQYFDRLRWMLQTDAELMERMAVFYEEILFNERDATEAEWKESRMFLDRLSRLRRRFVN